MKEKIEINKKAPAGQNGGQHTPGPWEAVPLPVQKGGGRGFNIDKRHSNGLRERVALIFNDRNNPHTDANARLIAAAPELLAALKLLLKNLDAENERVYGSPRPSDGSRDWKEQVEARAAIAKAEGRE